MSIWKTHSSTPVLTSGKWLSVELRSVETPTGQIIENWPWVTTPNYVNVLAVTSDGRYLVFRQGKYGFDGDSLAPVGGYIEPGEEPFHAAQRELLEETGCQADDWLPLGQFLVDPNRGVALGNLYLARGAHPVAERTADDLEEQHLLYLTRTELEKALLAGQFKVLAWAANIALALLADAA
jgi:ADP-ribose pyrophosphatase